MDLSMQLRRAYPAQLKVPSYLEQGQNGIKTISFKSGSCLLPKAFHFISTVRISQILHSEFS